MIAWSFRFLYKSTRVRWLVAVVASLMLHVVVFALLIRFIIVDGAFNMRVPQSAAGLSVNITQSSKQELPHANSPVSSPPKGDAFQQSARAGTSSSATAAIVFASGYFPVSELDVIPVIRRDINIFPAELSNLQGNAGKVIISLWIDESGHVVKSEMIESELPASYGEIVTRAFLQADFMPGMKNGSAVKSRFKVVIVYSSQPQDR